MHVLVQLRVSVCTRLHARARACVCIYHLFLEVDMKSVCRCRFIVKFTIVGFTAFLFSTR